MHKKKKTLHTRTQLMHRKLAKKTHTKHKVKKSARERGWWQNKKPMKRKYNVKIKHPFIMGKISYLKIKQLTTINENIKDLLYHIGINCLKHWCVCVCVWQRENIVVIRPMPSSHRIDSHEYISIGYSHKPYNIAATSVNIMLLFRTNQYSNQLIHNAL